MNMKLYNIKDEVILHRLDNHWTTLQLWKDVKNTTSRWKISKNSSGSVIVFNDSPPPPRLQCLLFSGGKKKKKNMIFPDISMTIPGLQNSPIYIYISIFFRSVIPPPLVISYPSDRDIPNSKIKLKVNRLND